MYFPKPENIWGDMEKCIEEDSGKRKRSDSSVILTFSLTLNGFRQYDTKCMHPHHLQFVYNHFSFQPYVTSLKKFGDLAFSHIKLRRHSVTVTPGSEGLFLPVVILDHLSCKHI